MGDGANFVSKRNRKRAQRLENLDVHAEGDDEENSTETISFNHGERPLRLISSARCYDHSNCDEYDQILLGSPLWWHQVIISQKVNCLRDVIPEIHKLVSCYFVPIAYKSSLSFDSFFVHDQGEALQRLFENKLQVEVKGRKIYLEVKLGVAKFEDGMLRPMDKLRDVLKSSIDPSAPYMLGLSQIAKHQLLTDMKFSLSNKACLSLLIKQMQHVWTHLERVKVVDLSSNSIQSLEPLSGLPFRLRVLNIKHNNISSTTEFQALVNVKIDKILLLGNPVVNVPGFYEELRQMLPQLKDTDEVLPPPIKTRSETVDTCEELELPRPSVTSARGIPEPSPSTSIIVIREAVLDKAKRDFSKHNNDWWNQVMVYHRGKVGKDKILSEMNKQLFNRTLFYPCYYQQHSDYDTFLLHKNFSALEMLVEKDLRMEIRSQRCAVTFELNLYYATWKEGDVDWQKSIDYVIKSRMLDSSLNLSNFADDPGFDDLIVSMTTVQGVSYILNAARNLNSTITEINLRGNGIASIEGLQFLRIFCNLKSIDLTANRIRSLENFPTMTSVTELLLDENDICLQFYEDCWKYVNELLIKCPKLKYVDGFRIDLAADIVPIQTYYVSQKLYQLIEKFINFFFKSFDYTNREHLDRLYEKDSLFSVSCAHQLGSAWENMRILLEHPNAKPKVTGGKNITKLHKAFPKAVHDFTTMCVDVPFSTGQLILVNVTGYFKQIAASSIEQDKVLGFARSFILVRRRLFNANSYKYVVKNELLLIRELLDDERSKAFRDAVVTDEDIADTRPKLMPTQVDREESAVKMLRDQTKLNRVWCQRILEDSSWNMAAAFKFVSRFIERKILVEYDFQ